MIRAVTTTYQLPSRTAHAYMNMHMSKSWVRRAMCTANAGGFHAVGTPPALQGKLQKRAWQMPTPVQAEALPAMFHAVGTAQDFQIFAPTGSGKTLAYALPVLQAALNRPAAVRSSASAKRLSAIIVVPTRELATQVTALLQELAEPGKRKAKSATVAPLVIRRLTGTMSALQLSTLRSDPPDIVVGTPGTLSALVPTHLPIHDLQWLVLDEVDALVTPWATKQVHALTRAVTQGRASRVKALKGGQPSVPGSLDPTHIVAVSATTSSAVSKFIAKHCLPHATRTVDLTQGTMKLPETLKHLAVHCPRDEQAKLATVSKLFGSLQPSPHAALLVAGSVEEADAVVEHCAKKNIPAASLVGTSARGRLRARALKGLASGQYRALACLPGMLRGLDLPRITHVVNLQVPLSARDYLHRAGRVGRTNRAQGTVVTLASSTEESNRLDAMAATLALQPVTGRAPEDVPEHATLQHVRIQSGHIRPTASVEDGDVSDGAAGR